MHLEIPEDIEASLQSRAKAAGFHSAEQYALSVLNQLEPSDDENSSKQTSDEWIARLRAFAARHPENIEAYNDGKDAWIKRIEPLATEWFRNSQVSAREQNVVLLLRQ